MVASGPEEVQLFGTPEVLAHLLYRGAAGSGDVAIGTFDALRVSATADGVEAWERVRAIVTDDPTQLDPSLPLRPPLSSGRSRIELIADHADLELTRDASGVPLTYDLAAEEVTQIDLEHPKGQTTAACCPSPRSCF